MPKRHDRIPHIPDTISFRSLGDEVFIMRLDSGTTFSLNETAACIWNAIDGDSGVADIAEILTVRYEVTEEGAVDVVLRVLDELGAAGLVMFRDNHD